MPVRVKKTRHEKNPWRRFTSVGSDALAAAIQPNLNESLLFRVEPSRGALPIDLLPIGSLPIPGINGRVIHGS
jgi:hypothetical protein